MAELADYRIDGSTRGKTMSVGRISLAWTRAHAAGRLLRILVMTKVQHRVHAALARESRLDLNEFPLRLSFVEGLLTLEGEVPAIAAKKLPLERAGVPPEATGILDRLRIRPAQRMGDGEIRDPLRNAPLQEPASADFTIRKTNTAQVLEQARRAKLLSRQAVEDLALQRVCSAMRCRRWS